MEYTESKLQAGLEICLAQYNATAQQKMELVFFTESIRHIARLTRVLVSGVLKNLYMCMLIPKYLHLIYYKFAIDLI